MRDIAILVFAAIGAITAIIKVLPEFGVDLRTIGRRKVPLDQIKTRPRARAWVVLVVALISLGLSLGAFYYFFRPRTVEKNVEKKAQLGAGELQPRSRSGLEYVWVPPGTFTMGCSRGDTWCDPPNAKHYEEKPAHQVSLTNGFWIGQTEVTVDAYRRYVAVTGRQMPTTPRFNLKWADGHQPIVNVNWEEARHFCEWDDGRLPTEAEWEYAARGKIAAPRYGEIDDIAWYLNNSDNGAHDAAQKNPNYLGMYDTIGNAWEWVSDWYGEDYKSDPVRDPTGPKDGNEKILRGGSYRAAPEFDRFTNRNRDVPTKGSNVSGVRCVRD